MHLATRFLVGIGVSVFSAACSGSDSDNQVAPWQSGSGSAESTAGAGDDAASPTDGAAVELEGLPPTGAAACDEWRDALIARIEECDDDDASDRIESASSVICAADIPLSECVEQLDSGSCSSSTFAGCDIGDVADRDAAVAECQRVVSAVCDFNVGCGQSDSSRDCAEAVASDSLDCDRAWGASSDVDNCISGVEALQCDAENLPAVCLGVIKLTSSDPD